MDEIGELAQLILIILTFRSDDALFNFRGSIAGSLIAALCVIEVGAGARSVAIVEWQPPGIAKNECHELSNIFLL